MVVLLAESHSAGKNVFKMGSSLYSLEIMSQQSTLASSINLGNKLSILSVNTSLIVVACCCTDTTCASAMNVTNIQKMK
jgi:hypothetical protein